MIRNSIVRDYSKYARAYGFDKSDNDIAIARLSLKEQMRINAINDNGIYKTFSFSENYYKLTLDYIKIEDKDIDNIPDMFEKRWYFRHIYSCNYPPRGQDLYTPCSSLEFQYILSSCLLYNETNEIDDRLTIEFEKIKKECVEKYNAVYSSVNIDNIEINKERELITINCRYHYIKDEFIDKMSSYDVIFGEAPLPYAEWFTVYFGPNPKDRPRRKDGIALTKDVEVTLNKGCIDCSAHDPKTIIVNPDLDFTIDGDKLYMCNRLPEDTYGKNTWKCSLIMTKEVFQECYNRWIKPQEECKSIEQ